MTHLAGSDLALTRGLHSQSRDPIDSSGLGSWILAAWAGAAMAVLFPAALVLLTPSTASSVWWLSLIVTTLSALRWAWIVAEGRRRLFEMSFWVFTYVFLGVAPLVQMRSGINPQTTPRLDADLQQAAMVVVIVGLAAFVVGLSFTAPTHRKLFRGRYVHDGADLTRTVLLAFVALLSAVFYIGKIGLGTLFSTRDEAVIAVAAAWPESSVAALISGFTVMTLLVSFIALVNAIRETRSRDWPLVALCVCVGVVLAVVANPITSPRYVFGTAALAVAALFGLFATPRLFRTTAILWVVALIGLFPLADAFRYSSEGEIKAGSVVESLTSADFDAFAQINNTLLYVDRHGFTDGEQAVGVLLFWVPRGIWPDKPRDTGILLAASRSYSFQNLSAPLWSELYVNAGWPLLILGMILAGALVRKLDGRIEESLQRARAPGILACVMPFYLVILLRGSLLQAMSYLTVILACTAFVARWRKVDAR
ncbi:oligosaccharide repeat unit polymerase [Mycobacterium sp. NPDC051804]|uniref:oligosaccharide repeat unit polymerase n=1 Tax=Mycobacterium sp. NPDC051804 TaxID=3364295 RepID=UPI0037AF8E89